MVGTRHAESENKASGHGVPCPYVANREQIQDNEPKANARTFRSLAEGKSKELKSKRKSMRTLHAASLPPYPICNL